MSGLIDVSVLKVFVGETARYEGKPLYEALVAAARSKGLAGATVTRGVMGFGGNSLVHTAKILRMSEDMPMVVEIVDTPARIEEFLPLAQAMLVEGSLVVESAKGVFRLPLRVRDVMHADVAVTRPETPLSEVVELLLKRRVKALPVVEKERPVGMITGGDLLRAGMPLRLDVCWQLPREMLAGHLAELARLGRTARDVMQSPVRTVTVGTGLVEVLDRMASGRLKRLPVVDGEGKLLGIVSRVDVLGAIGRIAAVSPDLPDLPPGAACVASDVLYADVPVVGPLEEVLALLVASPLRRVVVVDAERTVLGVVLDRDLVAELVRQQRPGLLRAILAALSGEGPKPGELVGTAREAMRAEVYSVGPDTPLADVVRVLVDKGVKRLVVTDALGCLLGMVDRDAVLRRLAGY